MLGRRCVEGVTCLKFPKLLSFCLGFREKLCGLRACGFPRRVPRLEYPRGTAGSEVHSAPHCGLGSPHMPASKMPFPPLLSSPQVLLVTFPLLRLLSCPLRVTEGITLPLVLVLGVHLRAVHLIGGRGVSVTCPWNSQEGGFPGAQSPDPVSRRSSTCYVLGSSLICILILSASFVGKRSFI